MPLRCIAVVRNVRNVSGARESVVVHVRNAGTEAGQVLLEGTLLENVFSFTYLGSDFQADGNQEQAVKVRMAMAKSVFGHLMSVWNSDLATPKKLYLYSAAVISVLVYGFESWNLSDAILSSLKGCNARCLAHITGKGPNLQADQQAQGQKTEVGKGGV